MIQVIGAPSGVDVGDSVTFFDWDAVSQEPAEDTRDPRGHWVGRIHRNTLSEILDAIHGDHRADPLSAVDMSTDFLLSEKDTVPNRFHRSLIGVAHDLSGWFVPQTFAGVFEHRTDLWPSNGVDHGITILAGHVARAQSNDDRGDASPKPPVFAQHRGLDEDLGLPSVKHILEVQRSHCDGAGAVCLDHLRHVSRKQPSYTLDGGLAVEDGFRETHLASHSLRVPSFEHENGLETLHEKVLGGCRRQLASASDQHSVVARLHPPPVISRARSGMTHDSRLTSARGSVLAGLVLAHSSLRSSPCHLTISFRSDSQGYDPLPISSIFRSPSSS